MAGLHQRHQADKKAQGLLDGRGFDTQRLPGAPLAGKTPQTHPAAQAKTQVTASCEPAQLKSVVLTHSLARRSISFAVIFDELLQASLVTGEQLSMRANDASALCGEGVNSDVELQVVQSDPVVGIAAEQ